MTLPSLWAARETTSERPGLAGIGSSRNVGKVFPTRAQLPTSERRFLPAAGILSSSSPCRLIPVCMRPKEGRIRSALSQMSPQGDLRSPSPTTAYLGGQLSHDDAAAAAATKQQHTRQQRRKHKESHRSSKRALEMHQPTPKPWSWPSEFLPVGNNTVYCETMQLAEALKQKSVSSRNSDDAVKIWLSDLKKLPKNSLVQKLLTDYHLKPSFFDPFDVHLVQDSEQLAGVLKTDFDFIKAECSSRIVHTHDWDIRKQVDSMGNGYCVAYQPARSSKNNSFTQRIEARDLRRIFLDKQVESFEQGLNCLNLQNLSERIFQPSAIMDVDLVRLIERRLYTGDAGRQEGHMVVNEEWMLLTHGPTFSPLHIDAAGYCTMLVILAGEKHWYTISGRWRQVFTEFMLRGPGTVGYLHPICDTRLAEGDMIIQAPGTPHAVVTVDDSLAAGYFFYTAAHFARSIECIHRELTREAHTNDDISAKDFEKLALIMRNIEMEDLFTPEQKADVWTRLGFFLEDFGLVCRGEETERRRKKPRFARGKGQTSGGRQSPGANKTEKAKQTFLDACVEWYRASADAQVVEAM